MQQLSRPIRNLHRPLLNAASYRSSSSSSSPRLLKIGDVLRFSKRFTEADLDGYSDACGDRNPIHFDPDFARNVAGFERRRVVQGMLVASLFPSIIASHFPGAVYVSQTLQFKLPVYIEDEVVAEVQATNMREFKNRYLVKWLTKCYTNRECLALDGEATAIVPTLALKD